VTTPDRYVFGRSPDETRRLLLQSEIYAPATEHLLRRAGIAPGMRVLDVGCGAGDVTLAIARLVGPAGSALGVDANPDVLDEARKRAADEGLDNASFTVATLPRVELDEPVDALVGRLIIAHLPDRVNAVRELTKLVRPGGVVTFQDAVVTGVVRSEPAVPLYGRIVDWCLAAMRLAGADPEAGLVVPEIMTEAGLADVESEAATTAAEAPDPAAFERTVEHVLLSFMSLRPLILKHGLATAEEVDLDALRTRLHEELAAAGAVPYSPNLVGAWARVPG
jgi:SAM-dependent methyltransferase